MPIQMFPIHVVKIFVLLTLFAACNIQAQQPGNSESVVKYTPEFKFKEGIFLNFDQVRQNDPIDKSSIITDLAFDNPDFFDLILKEKKIQLFDNLGSRQEIQTKNIWGFSSNGVL